jgi:hypothetical protein
MSSTRPDRIATPSISAYPYIRLLYENIECYRPGDPWDWDRVGPHVVEDEDFDYFKQQTPSKIDSALMTPLVAMSDTTFEALCKVLKPKFGGEIITSRNSLADLAQRQYGTMNDASLDQVMAYLFLTARANRYVEWARLADLYNESPDDQQEALFRHFTVGRNRDIGKLLAVQAPVYDLPSAFDQPLQTRAGNDQTQAFDVAAGKWLREDFVMNQFEVYGTDSFFRELLMATAPTLELAIARSIKGTMNYKGKLSRISIAQHGRYLAAGDIEFTSGIHPHVKDKDPRIKWTHTDLRPEKNEGGITKREFLKTLYATESAMGMQWSKVARLEDELGL